MPTQKTEYVVYESKCIMRAFRDSVEVEVIPCENETKANYKAVEMLSSKQGYTHTTIETTEGVELGIFGKSWNDVKSIIH